MLHLHEEEIRSRAAKAARRFATICTAVPAALVAARPEQPMTSAAAIRAALRKRIRPGRPRRSFIEKPRGVNVRLLWAGVDSSLQRRDSCAKDYRPLKFERASGVSVPQAPVEPNPPVLRFVSSRLSTSAKRAWMRRTMRICAMRSPAKSACGLGPTLVITTLISPR